METIMFAVGVLTMVLVALAALAVYSTVMVLKLKKRTEEMLRNVQSEANNIYRNINDIENGLKTEIRLGEQLIDQLRSYTDRRIDKIIDGYLLVKETEKAEKESKKLIKG